MSRASDAPADGSRSVTGRRGDLSVLRPGIVPYAVGLKLQDELVARRRAGQIADTLVLLEHPHVITLGSSADRRDVLADAVQRARLGIELHEAGRGGGVTYHGPGQLVVYPIVDLKPDRKDVHAYVRDLEGVLVETCAALGVAASRRDGLTGVWTRSGKIAAIGVRVASQWITSHGVALNVSPDLAYFDAIVPCGIAGARVTSLERELGSPIGVDRAARAFVRSFAEAFGHEIHVA